MPEESQRWQGTDQFHCRFGYSTLVFGVDHEESVPTLESSIFKIGGERVVREPIHRWISAIVGQVGARSDGQFFIAAFQETRIPAIPRKIELLLDRAQPIRCTESL